MKKGEKQQSKLNEETYKTNVTNQDKPKTNLKLLPSETNYKQTKLRKYANEHKVQRPQKKGN